MNVPASLSHCAAKFRALRSRCPARWSSRFGRADRQEMPPICGSIAEPELLLAHELEEPAGRSLSGLLRIEEAEVGLVEHLEELLSGNLLQLVVVVSAGLIEIEAQDLRALHHGRLGTALLGPVPDDVVIPRGLTLTAGLSPAPARRRGSFRPACVRLLIGERFLALDCVLLRPGEAAFLLMPDCALLRLDEVAFLAPDCVLLRLDAAAFLLAPDCVLPRLDEAA